MKSNTQHPRSSTGIYKSLGIYLLLLLSLQSNAFAQTTVTIGTSSSSSYLYGPYYRSSSGSSYNYSRYAYVYTASELNIPPGSIITKIEWHKRSGTISGNNEFYIYMKNTTSSSLSSGTTWGTLNSGTTSVYSSNTQSFNTTGWVPFTLTTPFEYTGNNLMILTAHVKHGSASGSNNFYYTTSNGKAIGYARNTVLNNSTQLTTTSYGNKRPNIRITWVPGCSGDVIADPADITACSDDDVQFTSTFDSVQKYQWQVNTGTGWQDIGNDAIYSGTATNKLTVRNINPPYDQYQYRVIGINTIENCTVTSDSADITIIPTKQSSILLAAGPDSNICKNEQVTINSSYTNGGSNPAYQWLRNGLIMPGETNAALVTNTIDQGDIIQCKFTSSAQCVKPAVSKGIKFYVNPNANASVGISSIYNGNNSYTFIANPVNGGTNPTYHWYVNNKLVLNQNSQNFTTDNLHSYDKVHVEMESSLTCVEPRLSSSNLKTTGITNPGINNIALNISPNPNTGQFVISGDIKTTESPNTLKISISNALGQVVYKNIFSLNSSHISIPVTMDADVANGVYMVNITTGGNIFHSRLVIDK